MAGGYRKPTKPAAVSGPGKFSKRTDGGVSQPIRDMTGGAYGEGQQMHNLQAAAPMSASGRSPQAPSVTPSAPPGADVPLNAPSQMPNQPVTAGAPVGPGPGPEATSASPGPQDSLERFRPYMPVLVYQANQPDASNALRAFVRYLKANL